MTLDTRVAIGGRAVNAREVFDLARAMVNTPADVEPRTAQRFDQALGVKHLSNPGGIGADAWLITYYGADGPLLAHRCTDDCYLDDPDDMDDPTEERCLEARCRDRGDPRDSGWASMILSFDTAYGYRNDEGMGCADLHRRYIETLYAYTQRKGLLLKWQNEFTGEWFDGLAGLDAFGRASENAEAWFAETVAPALARMGYSRSHPAMTA